MVDLENIDRTENYKIPENYFEEFPGRVMRRIEKEKIKRKTWIASGVAAVAVVAIAAAFFFSFNAGSNSDILAIQNAETELNESEILESLATNYYSEELAMMDYYNSSEY